MSASDSKIECLYGLKEVFDTCFQSLDITHSPPQHTSQSFPGKGLPSATHHSRSHKIKLGSAIEVVVGNRRVMTNLVAVLKLKMPMEEPHHLVMPKLHAALQNAVWIKAKSQKLKAAHLREPVPNCVSSPKLPRQPPRSLISRCSGIITWALSF